MKKIVSFVFVVLTLVLTGCDARWGGSDPVVPPPPQTNNHYSLFGGSGAKVTPLPDRPRDEQVLPQGTVPGLVANPSRNNAQTQQPRVAMETVFQPFKLPSRQYPGAWKVVYIKVDLPANVDQNTRNLAIAKHEALLRELDKHVEDYLPLSRSGPQQVR